MTRDITIFLSKEYNKLEKIKLHKNYKIQTYINTFNTYLLHEKEI